jgi:hypothetical protein
MEAVRRKRCVSETLKKSVAAGQRWTCAACGNLLSAHYEVDHRVALWRGGANDAANLQAMCRECHANKGFVESEQERARLEERVRLQAARARLHSHFAPADGSLVPRSLVEARCGWAAAQASDILQALGHATSDAPVTFPPMMWRGAWADAGVAGAATDFAVAGLRVLPVAAAAPRAAPRSAPRAAPRAAAEPSALWEEFRFVNMRVD